MKLSLQCHRLLNTELRYTWVQAELRWRTTRPGGPSPRLATGDWWKTRIVGQEPIYKSTDIYISLDFLAFSIWPPLIFHGLFLASTSGRVFSAPTPSSCTSSSSSTGGRPNKPLPTGACAPKPRMVQKKPFAQEKGISKKAF